MRRKQHRGRNTPVDRPLSIEEIESRFNKRLEDKQLLAEAFMLGRNKYGKADTTPMMKAAL
jgi:hypothetical protein